MSEPDDHYELVMPFVACASNGGPYDDDAFVAGYHAGQIGRSLVAIAAVGGSELSVTTYVKLLPQLDLIAMQHGFQVESEDAADAEGWTFATFRRQP